MKNIVLLESKVLICVRVSETELFQHSFLHFCYPSLSDLFGIVIMAGKNSDKPEALVLQNMEGFMTEPSSKYSFTSLCSTLTITCITYPYNRCVESPKTMLL